MIEDTTIKTLYEIFRSVPEMEGRTTLNEIHERIGNTYLAQIYRVDSEIAGFKLGYALSDREFYSWLGGVLPQHRRRGIARALLESQEQWAGERGFECIRVKSKNRFPGMISMLIGSGYIIEDFTRGEFPSENKIHFYKHL